MTVLVIGGSGSGKSAYAEKTAVSLARTCSDKNGKKYYLATMQVFDGEGKEKVKRHRELRSGKGFLTVEQPRAVSDAIKKMEPGERTVLLECISNLTANEMFSEERKPEERVAQDVVRSVKILKEQSAHLVIVSNNVFEDGEVYSEETTEYIRAMGEINRKLAALADRVVEVTAGIPTVIKG